MRLNTTWIVPSCLSAVAHVVVLGLLAVEGATTLTSFDVRQGRAAVQLMASMASVAAPQPAVEIEVTQPPEPAQAPELSFPEPAVAMSRRLHESVLSPVRPAPPTPSPPLTEVAAVFHPLRPKSLTEATTMKALQIERKPLRQPDIGQAEATASDSVASQASDGADVDEEPTSLSNPAPPYPADAVAAGLEGVVDLRLVIDVEGRVKAAWIKTSSGVASLDKSALKTLLAWRFTPARRRGEAVEITTTKAFRFTIRNR